jgi:hypothetical protein
MRAAQGSQVSFSGGVQGAFLGYGGDSLRAAELPSRCRAVESHTQPYIADDSFTAQAYRKLGHTDKARAHFQAAAAVFSLRLGATHSLTREVIFPYYH